MNLHLNSIQLTKVSMMIHRFPLRIMLLHISYNIFDIIFLTSCITYPYIYISRRSTQRVWIHECISLSLQYAVMIAIAFELIRQFPCCLIDFLILSFYLLGNSNPLYQDIKRRLYPLIPKFFYALEYDPKDSLLFCKLKHPLPVESFHVRQSVHLWIQGITDKIKECCFRHSKPSVVLPPLQEC